MQLANRPLRVGVCNRPSLRERSRAARSDKDSTRYCYPWRARGQTRVVFTEGRNCRSVRIQGVMENLDANGHNAAETQNQVRTRAANPQIERRNRSEVPM